MAYSIGAGCAMGDGSDTVEVYSLLSYNRHLRFLEQRLLLISLIVINCQRN